MTIDEMFNELDNYKIIDAFIVTLKYKYDFEENYTIENHILEYDSLDDSYVWLNDWYEGQTDVEVLGYIPLSDVDTTKTLTCKNCVSRESVLMELDKYLCGVPFDEKGIDEVIKDLPSVTPQPKTGRWVEETINEWTRKVFCSECGCRPPFEHVHVCNGDVYSTGGYGVINKTKFCPNCGAKMEEVNSDAK